MLKLFRKIFGCWSEPEIVDIKLDDPEKTIVINPTDNTFTESDYNYKCNSCNETSRKKEIQKIVDSTIGEKVKGFISYQEEAMSNVTGNKFKYIKYREII